MLPLLFLALSVPFQQHGYSSRAGKPRSHAAGSGVKNPLDYTSDGEFLKATAEHNAFLLELFVWTREHAEDPNVRRVAAKLQASHTRFLDDLRKLAARKHVSLPDPVNSVEDAHSFVGSLRHEEVGRSFSDAVWNHALVEIARFQAEARNGTDPDIKRWASTEIDVFDDDQRLVQPLRPPHPEP